MAQWLVDHLPPGERFVDLFAGGCAVTHCAILSGKWRSFLVNDINDTPRLFLDAIAGKYHNEARWISREDFFRLKDSDPYVRQCWSFGNDGKSYMYSRELEPYKKAVHMELLSNTVHERYLWHKKAVCELASIVVRSLGSMGSLQSLESLERLQSLERLESLERLQSLERLESLERLQSLQSDYRDVPLLPGDVIYCDIPYINTGAEYTRGFDHEAFYAWCEQQPYPVFVSEYTMPEDRFAAIAEKERCGHLAANKNNHRVIERLYVQRRFAGDFRLC